MRKILTGTAILAAVFAGVLFADDKTPAIDEIMKKVNGKNGLHKKIGQGLKSASPSWDDLGKSMKEYEKFASNLGKNDCPMGDKKNWEKLTKQYAENAKKLQDAIDKKDKSAAETAHKAIQDSCKACHDA